MRRFIYTILLIGLCLTTQTAMGQVSALTTDSLTICQLLDEARRQPRTTNFPLYFARQFLGRPDVAHTLEINNQERSTVRRWWRMSPP